MHEETAVEREMPRYQCHKKVWALKIKEIQYTEATNDGAQGATIIPADEGYDAFDVDAAYVGKHDPQVGGYFVVYEPDGYQSFSPADVFEAGYTLIS